MPNLVQIGPAVWHRSHMFLICDTLTPPLLGSRGVNVLAYYVHYQMTLHICVPNLVPIGPAVWHHSHIFLICDTLTPLKCPLGLEGLIFFSRCPFPDESACVPNLAIPIGSVVWKHSHICDFFYPLNPQQCPWVVASQFFFR